MSDTTGFDIWYAAQFGGALADDETHFDRGELWDAYNAGRADEANRISAAFPRHKIEWLIHTLDLIDKLAKSRGMDTSTEAQDDLRKLADLLEGSDG